MKLLLVYLLLFSSQVMAWDDLMRLEVGNHNVILELDEDTSEIRIKHRLISSWGLYKKGPKLSIGNPSAVDATLLAVHNFLRVDLNAESETEAITSLTNRIEEFKYISNKECRALHFDIEGQAANAAPIETLLDQVNRIRLAQSPGEEAFRSIHINTFETSAGPIQLRMVLDRDGNFLKFSFAKEEGSLVDYTWEHRNGLIILHSPEKEILLEIDTSSFANDGGLLIVKSLTSERVEQESRSFFRLSRSTERRQVKWDVVPYRTNHFRSSIIRNGVPLTTAIADHTPVIQLRDREIVFKRLSPEDIEQLDILNTIDAVQNVALEQLYNQCMGERLSFSLEEERFSNTPSTLIESEQSNLCLRKTQVEALGLSLGFPENSELKDFRTCLKNQNIAQRNSSFFSYNLEKIVELSSEEYESLLIACYRQEREESLASLLNTEIMSSTAFQEVLPGERSLELLAEQILNPYRKDCLEIIEVTRVEECRGYAAFLLESELFSTEVATRLITMDGLVENSLALGNEAIIGPLAACQDLRSLEASQFIREGRSVADTILALSDSRLSCAKSSMVEFVSLIDKSFFTSALARAGLNSEINSTEEELKQMRDSLKMCWSQYIADESELTSLIEDADYHLEACLPSILQPLVAAKLSQEMLPLIEEYSSFTNRSEESTSEVTRLVGNLISQELIQWRDIDQLEVIKETLKPKVLSLLYTQHVSQVINSRTELSEEERISLQSIASRSINSTEWSELSARGESYFSVGLESANNSGEIKIRESLKRFHMDSSEIISRAEGRSRTFPNNEESEIELGVKGREAFNRCLTEYFANSSQSLHTRYLECEKKRLARIRLFSAIESNEARVSALLPLSSRDANKILVTNEYLGQCFNSVDEFGNNTIEEFSQSLENCVDLAEFDISMSLSLAQIEAYQDISQLRGERLDQSINCFSRVLVENRDLSDEEASTLSDTLKEIRERSNLEGGLLSLVSGAHIDGGSYSIESSRILSKLVTGKLFDNDEDRASWSRGIDACEAQIDDVVKAEFREYVMRSIPSLDLVDTEDPNTNLMRDFLDIELVELILEFQRVNEAKLVGNRVQITESSLDSRLITSELGMGMLVNFVDLLGELIGKGFMYDEAAMRTELVVFQSELKGFLRWYTSNSEVVSIADAQDFFQSSKLFEHLSMAVVSEKVYESFLTGISEMRKREMDALFARKRCFDNESCLSRTERARYREINEKYDELRELSREMTSSYDFRRIIRPETDQGREIIEAIKGSYLMPRAIGQRMNARAEESMMNLIGEAILRDNTDGGFAERFVHIMAQSELDSEKDRRWRLTEYLLFDEQDFNWERLRETDSGLRAIDYYSRFIMLPEALGRPLGRYELRLRSEQFRRLITDAQSENRD